MLATANTGKNRERFGKNAGEWTGRVEIRKKSLAISVECLAIYTDLLQALKGERFSSVFSPDGTFNFCVRSSLLRGEKAESCREDLWSETQVKGP